MNDLQHLLDEYLATRRALGAELRLCGRLLQRFVAFTAQRECRFSLYSDENRGFFPN